MLFSLGWILLFGFLIGWLLNQIKIPGLVGMILIGLLFGPYCLSWIDSSLLEISGILRQIALIVILTRSGLNLDISSLKKIGRPAILMSFLPATSFLLVGIEDLVKPWISVSSLLAILVVAIILLWKQPLKAKEIEKGYSGLWKGFEILLFVLVGATVDYHYILNSGGMVLALLGIGLIFRMIGVFLFDCHFPFGKRTVIYHDCLFTESHRTGFHRRNCLIFGIILRKCRVNRIGIIHIDHGSDRSAVD